MNDLDEFAEVALAIFVALTLLIWLLTYLERTISRPLTEKRTRHPTEKKSRAARQQLASQVNTLDPSIHRWKRSSSRVVRDEFQEAAVGIPEVDADPLTLGLRPCIHGHHPESNGVMHLALAPLAKLASFG